MAYELAVGTVNSQSRLASAYSPGDTEDGVLEVEDYAEAAKLVDNHHNVEWVDRDPGPPSETVDDGGDENEDEDEDSADICGVEMSDGSTCERLADECPYHGEE